MSKKFTSYGLRSIYVVPLIKDDQQEAVYGSDLVRCWGAQEASANIEVTESELRGDDGVVEIDSTISSVDWSFSNAIITFEQAEVILGGKIEDIIKQSEKIGEKYTLKGGSALPYFGFIGTTEKDGTLKVVLHKCKATGGIEFSFADEDYCVLSVSGKSVKRDYDDHMFQLKKYDANNPVNVSDFLDEDSGDTSEE